jgi:hypothetical protein
MNWRLRKPLLSMAMNFVHACCLKSLHFPPNPICSNLLMRSHTSFYITLVWCHPRKLLPICIFICAKYRFFLVANSMIFRNHQNSKESFSITRFLSISIVGSKKNKGCSKFSFHILITNVESAYGWLSPQLYHKIRKKKPTVV